MSKKYNNRGRWLKSELDGLYRLSIDRRVPVESLVNLSKKKRTFDSITTKMWKEFGTAVRRGEDGLHYLHLLGGVPPITRTRRCKVELDVKPVSKMVFPKVKSCLPSEHDIAAMRIPVYY